ncbi:NACHT domain-containing protein [Streptomyces sp. BK79]|uniref:NACHT domain-containing protein n=1 Tax=Streptomyces sp. BK79 TaxID=3350097 RepID=UPI00376F5E3D
MASAVFAVRNINDNSKPVDKATLLSLLAGVVGAALAGMALRKPIEGNDGELARSRAKTLERQVQTGESTVRRQLLGADRRRINLAYVLHPAAGRAAIAPPAGSTFTDEPAAADLPNVLDYYRATRPRRLVITGAGGAGKTVLALELMLALLKERADDDPVPVRIPLAQWDTSQPLATLLVQRLVDAYDWPRDRAASLVDQGMVLPVLDGLDEMDPVRDDGTPDPQPPRALAALEALNAYQEGLDAGPLVLTCRTQHYDSLAPALQLIDAARIAIAPVNTQQAITYLRDRALDPPRWQPLLDYLQAHPTGPLAATLSTPWRLCLTATVYHRTGNPAELLDHPTTHALDQDLLARYIPAATETATANTSNPRHYTPDQVHRWLHHLTHHLDGTTTRNPATDLTLHRLWPLAGRTRVRITDALLTALTVLLLPLAVLFPLTGYIDFSSRLQVIMILAAGAFALRAAEPRRLPSIRKDNHEGTRLRGLLRGLTRWLTRWLTRGLGFGFALATVTGLWVALDARLDGQLDGGLAEGLDVGLSHGSIFGVLGWLGYGVMDALRSSLSREPTPAANPGKIVRDDMVHGLVVGLVAVPWVWGGFWLPIAFPVSFALGLTLAFALTVGLGATRRYGVFLLCSRGRLPFRLARFMDWAVPAGLLRYSGAAYQFRHRELQQWLAQHPPP